MLIQVRSMIGRFILAAKAGIVSNAFTELQAYCMFIGYERSGHSLIGSLLDAHCNAIIAHEADALRLVKDNRTPNQIFSALVSNSRRFAAEGRQWTGYSYQVPDQYQGQSDRLLVIGDKKGGQSSLHLRREPDLLSNLRDLLGDIQLKLIHVVRNPFDNITTISIRNNKSLHDATELYRAMCEGVVVAKQHHDQELIFDVSHESFVAEPHDQLRRLCSFLGIEAQEDYIRSCAQIVRAEPNKSRFKIEWPAENLRNVEELIARYDFLQGYSFNK